MYGPLGTKFANQMVLTTDLKNLQNMYICKLSVIHIQKNNNLRLRERVSALIS